MKDISAPCPLVRYRLPYFRRFEVSVFLTSRTFPFSVFAIGSPLYLHDHTHFQAQQTSADNTFRCRQLSTRESPSPWISGQQQTAPDYVSREYVNLASERSMIRRAVPEYGRIDLYLARIPAANTSLKFVPYQRSVVSAIYRMPLWSSRVITQVSPPLSVLLRCLVRSRNSYWYYCTTAACSPSRRCHVSS